ncbi:MAG TPA: endonuclease III [Gemmataceae bacterium]|nr:endonuclease III [Gemmataceae bacterium]
MSTRKDGQENPKLPARRTLSPLIQLRRRVRRILNGLAHLYPDAKCALHFDGPLQLLVATILSAQCTDRQVNLVTPALFARYPDAQAFANAKQAELEKMIQKIGFFRSKARNLIACCKELVAKHGGAVPSTMEELVPLAGVGRKTANVVLGNAFGVPGIPVDTHMRRLSQRMALTVHTDPVKIECDLMLLVPKKEWTRFGHRMIHHGRVICHSRRPLCERCSLAKECPQVGVGPRPAEESRA